MRFSKWGLGATRGSEKFFEKKKALKLMKCLTILANLLILLEENEQ